jgi:hypothetical protein
MASQSHFAFSRTRGYILGIVASFKFWAPLMLERQQARSRRLLVHANAPICSQHTFERGKVPAPATTVWTIARTISVRFKIRLHLDC